MDSSLIEVLLHKSESETLDFKQKQYRFSNGSDDEKSELLKDILAFANAWKEVDAHIVIGILEKDQRVESICGVTEHLQDHSVQQFVQAKTNRVINFSIQTVHYQGQDLDIIIISDRQSRPLFAKKTFGKVARDVVYIRRGSSTDIAGIDEIAAMGKGMVDANSSPIVAVEFADPLKRVRWGALCTLISTHLSDPPLPETSQTGRILPEGLCLPDAWMGTAETGPPSEKQWIEYLKGIASYQPIGFWLFNSSSVNATNILVEVRIPDVDGLLILNAHQGPQKPQSLADQIKRPSGLPALPLSLENNKHIVTVERGVLQPKAEYWSDGVVYVAAGSDISVDCDVRVFADDLPTPILSVLRLNVKSAQRRYSRAELRKFIELNR